MSEDVEIVEVVSEPMVHQVGKLVIGTLVAFAAGKLAEKVYDAGLTIYRQKTSS